MRDPILALQILTGVLETDVLGSDADVDSDSRISLTEAIYLLQWIAQIR